MDVIIVILFLISILFFLAFLSALPAFLLLFFFLALLLIEFVDEVVVGFLVLFGCVVFLYPLVLFSFLFFGRLVVLLALFHLFEVLVFDFLHHSIDAHPKVNHEYDQDRAFQEERRKKVRSSHVS